MVHPKIQRKSPPLVVLILDLAKGQSCDHNALPRERRKSGYRTFDVIRGEPNKKGSITFELEPSDLGDSAHPNGTKLP